MAFVANLIYPSSKTRKGLLRSSGVAVTGVEVLADALDRVRVDVARVGEDRTLRVRADNPYLGVVLLEVVPGASDGAAGAHPGDEVGDAPIRLLPHLGPRRFVVGEGVRRVLVLARLEAARYLARQPLRYRVIALRVVGSQAGRGDDHLGAQSLEKILLLLARLVWHHADALVTLDCRRERETGPCVPARRLDHGPAGLEEPHFLGDLEHLYGGPILHGPGRVQVL